MGPSIIVVTAIGLAVSTVLVVLSIRAGRRPPVHRALWIIALVALGISILFRLFLLVGIAMSGAPADALPILMGDLAVVGAFVAAFWRPAWTGWTLIGSALALPAIAWLLDTTTGLGLPEQSAAPAMLGFYAVPAIITGVLLILCEVRRRRPN